MTDFTTLSLAAATRSYNVVAVALGETEVRKFSDKPSALKRLTAIVGRAVGAGLEVSLTDGEITSVGPVVDPREEKIKDAETQAKIDAGDSLGYMEPEAETAPVATAKLATTLDLTAKVKILVANPKRAGSRAHAVFSLYADGQTGQQFVDAVVAAGHTVRVALTNLHWDLDHGFIYLGE